jgi:ribose transport system substrate-binding protein
MILKHPDFDALIGMDSLSGPAAITIWKAMGLKKVLLTFDNLPDILDGIKYGQITASISQNQYRWGELIIQYLDAACDGKEIPELIYTKTTEINKSNISSVDTSLVQ